MGLPRATPITFSLSRMLGFVSAAVITGVRDEKGSATPLSEAWFPLTRSPMDSAVCRPLLEKSARRGAHLHIDSIGEWSGSRVIYTTVKPVKHATLQPGQLRI
jgi:hypothetical protein